MEKGNFTHLFPLDPAARSTARRALALLLGLNLLNYLDRFILAAVELEVRNAFFPASDPNSRFKTGLLATVFLVSYMVTAPVFGRLADRMSRWTLIAVAAAVWSLATGATGLAAGYVMLVVTRAFVGIGEGGFGPAAPTLIADYYPVSERGKMMAWFYLAIPVGSAIGFAFGGKVAESYGWKMPFFLMTAPGLLLAAICAFQPDPREASTAAPRAETTLLGDLGQLVAIRSYVTNTAAMTAMTFAIGGISFWVPSYLSESRQLPDKGNVTLIFGAITAGAGALATLAGGWLGDRYRARVRGAYFVVSGIGMAIAVPCLLAMLWTPFPAAWALMFLAVFFLFFNTGPSNTALANAVPSGIRASGFAFNILLIHALGDAIAPPLLGKIIDTWSYNAAFYLVAAMMAVSSIIWLLGARSLDEDTERAEKASGPAAPATPAH